MTQRVFISYSHRDEAWKDRIAEQLGVLKQQGLLEVWDDRRIAAGDAWLPAIDTALNDCHTALLLGPAERAAWRVWLPSPVDGTNSSGTNLGGPSPSAGQQAGMPSAIGDGGEGIKQPSGVDSQGVASVSLQQPNPIPPATSLTPALYPPREREPEAALAACRATTLRADRTLDWGINYVTNASLLDIALNYLTLASAGLYTGLLNADAEALARAEPHAQAAVDGLRQAGQQQYIPLGLLTRAWLRAAQGRLEDAQLDLAEAQELAERGPMPLFLADVHLHRARLFGDKAELARAAELIHRHGYNRRFPELQDAQALLGRLD